MRLRLAVAAVLVLGVAEARGGGAERFVELSCIPADVEVILGFEDQDPGAAELLARLRDELLFASRLDERLAGVSKAADVLRVRRLVAGLVRLPSGSDAAIAILHGSFSREAAEAALLPAGGSLQSRGEVAIRLAPLGEGSSREQALAFIDQDTLAFGDLEAIERCLAVRSSRGGSVLADPATRLLLDDAASQGQAWGILRPQWLRFAEPRKDPQFPYHGVRESIAGIQLASFSAAVSSRVAFQMRTRAASDADAFVLGDALRAFLASFRTNPDGAPAVLKALETARVSAEGPTVSLHLDLPAEAMSRLKRNEASRRLLSWRLGAEERESREKVGEILARLGIGDGDQAADVGSGGGFYTVALARRVGDAGRVFAVDVDEHVLGELARRVTQAPFPQVEIVLGAPDDPKLPPGSLDAALIVNSYHEMPHHAEMLRHLWRALKPGGRLMLMEPFSVSRRSEPRGTQEKAHLIAPEIVEADLREAGFEVVTRIDEFVRGSEGSNLQSLVLGRRPLLH